MRTFSSAAYLTELMAELDRAAISARLAESREQAGLTQDEMADTLAIHFRSIQNYESPKVDRIPWDRLDEWARVTAVTKEWLLHGNQQKPGASDSQELRDEMSVSFEQLARKVNETRVEILDEVRGQAASWPAVQQDLREELAALRQIVERVEAGLARLADRQSPPSESAGP